MLLPATAGGGERVNGPWAFELDKAASGGGNHIGLHGSVTDSGANLARICAGEGRAEWNDGGSPPSAEQNRDYIEGERSDRVYEEMYQAAARGFARAEPAEGIQAESELDIDQGWPLGLDAGPSMQAAGGSALTIEFSRTRNGQVTPSTPDDSKLKVMQYSGTRIEDARGSTWERNADATAHRTPPEKAIARLETNLKSNQRFEPIGSTVWANARPQTDRESIQGQIIGGSGDLFSSYLAAESFYPARDVGMDALIAGPQISGESGEATRLTVPTVPTDLMQTKMILDADDFGPLEVIQDEPVKVSHFGDGLLLGGTMDLRTGFSPYEPGTGEARSVNFNGGTIQSVANGETIGFRRAILLESNFVPPQKSLNLRTLQVPEPSSLLVLATSTLLLIRRRRRGIGR